MGTDFFVIMFKLGRIIFRLRGADEYPFYFGLAQDEIKRSMVFFIFKNYNMYQKEVLQKTGNL